MHSGQEAALHWTKAERPTAEEGGPKEGGPSRPSSAFRTETSLAVPAAHWLGHPQHPLRLPALAILALSQVL